MRTLQYRRYYTQYHTNKTTRARSEQRLGIISQRREPERYLGRGYIASKVDLAPRRRCCAITSSAVVHHTLFFIKLIFLPLYEARRAATHARGDALARLPAAWLAKRRDGKKIKIKVAPSTYCTLLISWSFESGAARNGRNEPASGSFCTLQLHGKRADRIWRYIYDTGDDGLFCLICAADWHSKRIRGYSKGQSSKRPEARGRRSIIHCT